MFENRQDSQTWVNPRSNLSAILLPPIRITNPGGDGLLFVTL